MSDKSRIQSDAIASDRRDFLKLAAITGGTVAMAGLAGSGAVAADREPDGAAMPPTKKGYRVTSHIKEYYDKARF